MPGRRGRREEVEEGKEDPFANFFTETATSRRTRQDSGTEAPQAEATQEQSALGPVAAAAGDPSQEEPQSAQACSIQELSAKGPGIAPAAPGQEEIEEDFDDDTWEEDTSTSASADLPRKGPSQSEGEVKEPLPVLAEDASHPAGEAEESAPSRVSEILEEEPREAPHEDDDLSTSAGFGEETAEDSDDEPPAAPDEVERRYASIGNKEVTLDANVHSPGTAVEEVGPEIQAEWDRGPPAAPAEEASALPSQSEAEEDEEEDDAPDETAPPERDPAAHVAPSPEASAGLQAEWGQGQEPPAAPTEEGEEEADAQCDEEEDDSADDTAPAERDATPCLGSHSPVLAPAAAGHLEGQEEQGRALQQAPSLEVIEVALSSHEEQAQSLEVTCLPRPPAKACRRSRSHSSRPTPMQTPEEVPTPAAAPPSGHRPNPFVRPLSLRPMPNAERALSDRAVEMRAQRRYEEKVRSVLMNCPTNYAPQTERLSPRVQLDSLPQSAREHLLREGRREAEGWLEAENQKLKAAQQKAVVQARLQDWYAQREAVRQAERERQAAIDEEKERAEQQAKQRWKRRGESLQKRVACWAAEKAEREEKEERAAAEADKVAKEREKKKYQCYLESQKQRLEEWYLEKDRDQKPRYQEKDREQRKVSRRPRSKKPLESPRLQPAVHSG